MALKLDVRLPFGRYSATPWGRHVNEGAVEWPPSPWRIVRALASSWHINHPSIRQEQVTSALELLCAPPIYFLPRHVESTTRHYMPSMNDAAHKKKRETALALNPFVAVAPGSSIEIVWDTEVSGSQLATLTSLCNATTYLGRAESRVEIGVSTISEIPAGGLAHIDAGELGDSEYLDVLIPTVPLDWDALHTTTGRLHNNRRTVPDSTIWTAYRTPRTESPMARPSRQSAAPLTTVVQFAVSGRGRPLMAETALVTALLRRAATSRVSDHPALHGHTVSRGASKPPRTDDHRHAHYLAINDLASGNRIDRLVIWVPEGLSPVDVTGLSNLRTLFVPEYLQKRLGVRIDLALEHVGRSEVLDPRMTEFSKTWRTLTPFTTNRHRKKHETPEDFVDDVVRRALSHRQLPHESGEVEIRQILDTEVAGPLQARRIHRARSLGRDRQHTGFHVELNFASKVSGPLTLGSLSHFGLGTFVRGDDR